VPDPEVADNSRCLVFVEKCGITWPYDFNEPVEFPVYNVVSLVEKPAEFFSRTNAFSRVDVDPIPFSLLFPIV
jgi:hypothetical protein